MSDVSPTCLNENEYSELPAETLCQNSRSPRFPKQNFFRRKIELLSILSASFKAAFSILFSVGIGELHFVKNDNTKKVVIKSRVCLKACIQPLNIRYYFPNFFFKADNASCMVAGSFSEETVFSFLGFSVPLFSSFIESAIRLRAISTSRTVTSTFC